MGFKGPSKPTHSLIFMTSVGQWELCRAPCGDLGRRGHRHGEVSWGQRASGGSGGGWDLAGPGDGEMSALPCSFPLRRQLSVI